MLSVLLNLLQKINSNSVLVKEETLNKSLFYKPVQEVSKFMSPNLEKWYDEVKERTKEKDLWMRNIGSTVVSQFVDTIIFVPIAFIMISGIPGGYPKEIVWEIFWTTYLIKLFVAALDTPFVYLIKKIKPIEEKENLV